MLSGEAGHLEGQPTFTAEMAWHVLPSVYCERAYLVPTRNVVLTEQQAAMVARLVASGRYQNASEVLRDGLRLLQQREAEDQSRLDALRQAVAVGLEEIDSGRYLSFAEGETLRDRLTKRAASVLARSSE